MMKPLALAGALFVCPLIVNAQSIASFDTCSTAVNKLERFTQAGIDQTTSQLLNQDITQSQFDLRTAELADMQTTFTMDACMQGEFAPVYQCLAIKEGDLTSCR
ncbi:MAG: hypothetical protein K6L76_02895 [Agarilytica sp.]